MSRGLAALTLLLAMAGVARADESQTRSIWLECKAPATWPARTGAPLRLSCRIDSGERGPAYWTTVNPFARDPEPALVDPFEVDATARFVDVFETGRYARPRGARPPLPPLDQPSATIDPFEDTPAPTPAR